MYLATHNLTCEYGVTLKFGHLIPLTYIVYTTIAWCNMKVISQTYVHRVISKQTQESGKAIRPLFADPVTKYLLKCNCNFHYQHSFNIVKYPNACHMTKSLGKKCALDWHIVQLLLVLVT